VHLNAQTCYQPLSPSSLSTHSTSTLIIPFPCCLFTCNAQQEHSANSTTTQTSSSPRLAAHSDGMHQTMSKSRSFPHEPRTPASIANCQQHRARALATGSRPGPSPSSRHCPSHARLPLAARCSAGRCAVRDTTRPCCSTPRPPLTRLRRPVTSRAQRSVISKHHHGRKPPPASHRRSPLQLLARAPAQHSCPTGLVHSTTVSRPP
jgi:hypothetical protein